MSVIDDYLINKYTILLRGEYALSGKLCTRALEGFVTFLIDKSPVQLIDSNLKFMCSSFTASTEGAREIIGMNKSMCPIILNYTQGICMFPIISPTKKDNIWFNPEHIMKTQPIGNNTIVYLSNGHTIEINQTQATFHNKIQHAEQLTRITKHRANATMTLLLENKEQPTIIKDEEGLYRLGVIKPVSDTSRGHS